MADLNISRILSRRRKRIFRLFQRVMLRETLNALRRTSPRRTGRLAAGWQGTVRGGRMVITNPAADAYWSVLNHRRRHRGYIDLAFERAIHRVRQNMRRQGLRTSPRVTVKKHTVHFNIQLPALPL